MHRDVQLICLTPVKNEAWCLRSFLQAASLWADYIIIADQGSDDGSRKIAASFPKVILVDNPDSDLHETNRQRLLFAEARKIEGPKVFVALDADEIFTANFMETSDWQKIIHALPGDIFQFRWANIEPGCRHYSCPPELYQWAVYDDGTNPPTDGYIHIARVPWPENTPAREIVISDFQVMHLQKINVRRTLSKLRYYQCITAINEPRISAVSLYRQYHPQQPAECYEIPGYFTESYLKKGMDVFGQLNLNEPYFWQDIKICGYFNKYGTRVFRKLDIFDRTWREQMFSVSGKVINDPRRVSEKILHYYLRHTQRYAQILPIRIIDKLLKYCI
jgi:glycosyltransferase involved in cell wall biosynthesis